MRTLGDHKRRKAEHTMSCRRSSLTQEMNLARRACWTATPPDSQLLNFFSYVYYLFTTTITLLLHNCKTNSRRTIISNFSANSEKTSVHHLKKQIKFSNKFMLITVISCILLSSCVNYCEARPNLSTDANNGVDSGGGAGPSNVSIFLILFL